MQIICLHLIDIIISRYVERHGILSKNDYPLNDESTGNCRRGFIDEKKFHTAYGAGIQQKIISESDDFENVVKNYLVEKKLPVAIGEINIFSSCHMQFRIFLAIKIPHGSSFMKLENEIWNPSEAECNSPSEHHAVNIVGYGRDGQTGLAYWLIANSYGSTWGEAGFGRIAMTACIGPAYIRKF